MPKKNNRNKNKYHKKFPRFLRNKRAYVKTEKDHDGDTKYIYRCMRCGHTDWELFFTENWECSQCQRRINSGSDEE